ncbi:hypothetical protein KT71_18751 [Congregibacter litoralis KT71]|uniref:Transposase InsH N-terminal domain-containing protein n=1 Tax=Congregibacter litoralis KT71 TaxID=314285 RepID=A4ACU3_9GAMM|nr:hypothetical protein KT71_18751 [Congregibacter litoralis KT71]
MKQTTFAGLAYSQKKKQTRREKFLTEMNQVIPWDDLCALIEPHYPKPTKTRGGRVPLPLMTKLRIYCLQQFYDLSDPGAEEALYDRSRCAASPALNWAKTPSRTRVRSCSFGVFWSATTSRRPYLRPSINT